MLRVAYIIRHESGERVRCTRDDATPEDVERLVRFAKAMNAKTSSKIFVIVNEVNSDA